MKHLFGFILLVGCTAETVEPSTVGGGPDLERSWGYPAESKPGAGCPKGVYCADPLPKHPALICFPENEGASPLPEKGSMPGETPETPPWGPEAIKEQNNGSVQD